MKPKSIKKVLQRAADPERKISMQKYFKTEIGQYGYGDIFIGISVPMLRSITKQYSHLSISEIQELLTSPIHEYRLAALQILIHQFNKGSKKEQKSSYTFYVHHTQYINNWDLVDASAEYIVGRYLFEQQTTTVNPKKVLLKLAHSKNLWEKRIAIVATHYFIIQKQYELTFLIATELLTDPHDLIHKAVGWMLREAGKRSLIDEITYLDRYAAVMPRTAVRYAIERFEPILKKKYMQASTSRFSEQ